MTQERDSFVLYRSYMDAIWRLPDEHRQILAIRGITDFGFYNKVPKSDDWAVQMIFDMAMPTLEHSKNRWEAQKTRKNQGGRPQKVSHVEIVKLKETGMSNREIASEMGCSERYVAQVISDNRKALEAEEADASEEAEPDWPPDDTGGLEPGALYEDVKEQGYAACDGDYGSEPKLRELTELSFDEAEEIRDMIDDRVPFQQIEEKYQLRPYTVKRDFWQKYMAYDDAKYPRLKEWAEDIFHNGSTYHPETAENKVNDTKEEGTQPSDEVAGADGAAPVESNAGLAEGGNGEEVNDAPGRLPSELTLVEAEQVHDMIEKEIPLQEIEVKYNIKHGMLTRGFWDSYEKNQVKGWFEQLDISRREAQYLSTSITSWSSQILRNEERENNMPAESFTRNFWHYYIKYTVPAQERAQFEKYMAEHEDFYNNVNEVTQEPQAEEPDETDFDEDAVEELIEKQYGYLDDYPPF